MGVQKPSPNGKNGRWRSFLQNLGRATLATLVTSAAVLTYVTQKDKHPGQQLPFDPEKKTLVVLGSGWGATSLLKTMDTDDYNVVSSSRRQLCRRGVLSFDAPGRSSLARRTSSCSPRFCRAWLWVHSTRGLSFNVSHSVLCDGILLIDPSYTVHHAAQEAHRLRD